MRHKVLAGFTVLGIGLLLALLMMEPWLPYKRLDSSRVRVFYPNRYEAKAGEFAAQSELWLDEMCDWLGIRLPSQPALVPIVLGGWEPLPPRSLASGKKTAGYYWLGYIFILDKDGDNPPLSHEMAHWLLDYLGGAQVPRWFSEGFAQYAEDELTGYRLPLPEKATSKWKKGLELLPLDQLALEFEDPRNQRLAYWEAYSAFQGLLGQIDWLGMGDLLSRLQAGQTWDQAFHWVTGQKFSLWQEEWLAQWK